MLKRLFERALPDITGAGANATTGLSVYDWAKMFTPGGQVTFGGTRYQAYNTSGAPGGDTYTSNPVVFSLESIRILLFSEVRFSFQQMKNARPGDLFGTPELQLLEVPWPGHTTRDLLARAELDVFGSGNSYWVRNQDGFVRLDPAHTKLLVGKARENDISGVQIGDKLLGYAYVRDPNNVAIYTPDQVGHYKPYPDPRNPFLGVSWLSPCLPDIALDKTISAHKKSTLENGGSLSTIVTMDPTTNREQFDGFVDTFRRQHEGPDNASKTLFLLGGTDVKTVGQTFENLALQATQGSGEVRVAACAGIPPAIVGFSEGLKGSSLNAGNYGEARRRLADATMRPLWGTFAGAIASLINVPGGSRLWYDERDVAFLREDLADQANILAENAKSVMVLVQAGWEPNAAIEAVVTGDLNRLTDRHTGLYSVQLQPPLDGTMQTGGDDPKNAPAPSTPPVALPVGASNGNGKNA